MSIKKDSQSELKRKIEILEKEVQDLRSETLSTADINAWLHHHPNEIPVSGGSSLDVKTIIQRDANLDFKPRLNTSSYVNVVFDESEEELALLGLRVNLADQTVYPQSFKLHNSVINMIANLWHCPLDPDFDKYGVQPGAGTVGSTEACLLAGLALKARWRKWYANKHQLSADEILGVKPNIVISSLYQAAWEKLIKYMDVDVQLIYPSYKDFKIDPKALKDTINEKTMGVICIMGNHYGGQYDSVGEVNEIVEEINQSQGYQIGIHVDAASGGFIAPFQADVPAWDFRLNNVLSISASGHKYGESCCGTGWLVWRKREDLSEHVAIPITYLGGHAESYTLNFSRPASGTYVQFYKLIHLGIKGYEDICNTTMGYTQEIRNFLKKMTYQGKPRFVMLDDEDSHSLPVVAAMLNPECQLPYNDVDLQNALSQNHWYVSAYEMSLVHPITEKKTPLFHDQPDTQTMFRVVIKNNFSNTMVEHLRESFEHALEQLDSLSEKFNGDIDTTHLRNKDQIVTNHC
ncbi:MAG: hypothetical protein CMF42_00715 [Legionellales bacterium]|nr:hypothetical protein [Legionellales bacterium]OUX68281.1 MAG: hypothetical protein CBD38_00260 [bacterium TMED178]|tara:strand:- start:3776 stop:5332 length:1557 start_codon:yes stop_codon:yes gene_type:complete